MRIVLDTNILLSGFTKKGGIPDLIRREWEDKRFTLITSNWQIDELRRVSRYPRLAKRLNYYEMGRFINLLRAKALVLEHLPQIDESPDPDDNALLASAIAGQADYLVTGDKRHVLSLGKIKGIPIITARALVDLL
jgi:putative PIN family toxin of toxin-antitoxin system